jgi:HlyD family secretion protein
MLTAASWKHARSKPASANWEYTEVLEGLKAGDRIVTSLEKEGVKAGAVVTPDEKAKAK